ncbi:hypothetical protein PVA45_07115 (plasmid) [Entomospira entomophila]|uniref:Uncharacterized protein n=1 Tax=Entomospira entomophila TaxID=2719988 RepID=A0A968KTF0_9SPIO|nr:hypothetical protein [Entomospira entomophilus]NIZ41372.1 hypothetical protein [Entomospira entomophilus]WDI36217.1 hypothetical protein PVA45_07115 [Entomospira entomophilus]
MASRKRMWWIGLMIAFTSTCATAPSHTRMPKPAPPSSLGITWRDDGDRVSISKEDAVKLEQWLIDVEYYINS